MPQDWNPYQRSGIREDAGGDFVPDQFAACPVTPDGQVNPFWPSGFCEAAAGGGGSGVAVNWDNPTAVLYGPGVAVLWST